MRLSSRLLTSLQRAYSFARIEQGDTDPLVPGVILPTIHLSDPLESIVSSAANTVEQSTFMVEIEAGVGASQASTGNVVLRELAPGHWAINCYLYLVTSFDLSPLTANFEFVQVRLVSPAGSFGTITSLYARANIPQYNQRALRFLVGSPGTQLAYLRDATGVGQTARFRLTILATRLL